ASVDGSDCPDRPRELVESHTLLASGLIRIALPWPPKTSDGKAIRPEFTIEVEHDPTGCNNSPIYGLKSPDPKLSVYRRPRVTANFKYVIGELDGGGFMADGREPSLSTQAMNAAMTHEELSTPPTAAQLLRIVEFETQIFTAQA